MKNNKEVTHTPKELFTEMQSLVAEAQTMMGDSISEHTSEAMANLRVRFDAAQVRFAELYDGAKKQVVAGAKYTDTRIRDNPYQSLAVALGVGVILGVLVGRRSK